MTASLPPVWGEPRSETDGGHTSAPGPVSQAAHDLNNVLTIIAGSVALAERHAAGNPKLIRLLGNVRLATERGTLIARRLLETGGVAESIVGAPRWPADPAPVPPVKDPIRVLLVEDDLDVAELAATVLGDMGCVVETHHEARSALAALESGTRFNLVFSDIVMPGKMTGIELAEQIAVRFPHLPVLLATGFSTAALAPGALQFPILAKPYSVHELTRRVTQMLPART